MSFQFGGNSVSVVTITYTDENNVQHTEDCEKIIVNGDVVYTAPTWRTLFSGEWEKKNTGSQSLTTRMDLDIGQYWVNTYRISFTITDRWGDTLDNFVNTVMPVSCTLASSVRAVSGGIEITSLQPQATIKITKVEVLE